MINSAHELGNYDVWRVSWSDHLRLFQSIPGDARDGNLREYSKQFSDGATCGGVAEQPTE